MNSSKLLKNLTLLLSENSVLKYEKRNKLFSSYNSSVGFSKKHSVFAHHLEIILHIFSIAKKSKCNLLSENSLLSQYLLACDDFKKVLILRFLFILISWISFSHSQNKREVMNDCLLILKSVQY